MIAVICEVTPTTEGGSEYLQIAAELRILFENREGFISIERFQSLSDENKIFSLSFWRDEIAVKNSAMLSNTGRRRKKAKIRCSAPIEYVLQKCSGIIVERIEMKHPQIQYKN